MECKQVRDSDNRERVMTSLAFQTSAKSRHDKEKSACVSCACF